MHFVFPLIYPCLVFCFFLTICPQVGHVALGGIHVTPCLKKCLCTSSTVLLPTTCQLSASFLFVLLITFFHVGKWSSLISLNEQKSNHRGFIACSIVSNMSYFALVDKLHSLLGVSLGSTHGPHESRAETSLIVTR